MHDILCGPWGDGGVRIRGEFRTGGGGHGFWPLPVVDRDGAPRPPPRAPAVRGAGDHPAVPLPAVDLAREPRAATVGRRLVLVARDDSTEPVVERARRPEREAHGPVV